MITAINFKKLGENAITPSKSIKTDAGFDLYAAEDKILEPVSAMQKTKMFYTETSDDYISSCEDWSDEHKKQLMVSTQIAMSIPDGYYGKIEDRSSMALKALRTGGGVIDSSYRGEVKVIILNLRRDSYTIKKGDRIAQLVIHKLPTAKFQEVEELDMTERKGGFGSTGV